MGKYCIDLHVHTRRYSPCAETLDPEKLSLAAREAGLHGVVLTEHDAMWSEDEVLALEDRSRQRIKIYRGVEVSSIDGHFVVIGLRDMHGIQVGIPATELHMITKAASATMILAHPHRGGIITQHFGWTDQVDAIEIASTVTIGEYEADARNLASRADLPMVAGSDAHCLAMLGRAYTEFTHLPDNEMSLAQAIKANTGLAKRSG
ncbi:PHP domain-containing protein [Desulfuromusa kysingii]|uniref:PHP domain-containing protein n=1 Tax=Desulfuromusa kysingii TaxID=37625 RepID=A0A1H4DRC0_9BACT|nr:PHP domain-containing protein [Desulfuromusa kysingii]SEA75303.1 PHP domain-containing protein [Desulfuromusa kysingii]